jgi:NhaP-type Na+/H+ and K+/H+ antiporter
LEAEYGKEVVSRAKAEVDEKVQKGLLKIKKSATAYLTGMLRNLRLEGKMWKYMSSSRLEAESVIELDNQARSKAVTERLVQDAVHRKEVAKYYSSNYQQEMARLDTLPVDMPEELSIPKMEHKTILPKTTEEHLKDAKNIINAMLGGLIPELP